MYGAQRAGSSRWITLSLGCLATLAGFAGTGCAGIGALPKVTESFVEDLPGSTEQAAVEEREICVGSSVASAGELADVLYYRASVLPDGKLAVGYFAFFSDERPWGNNWLTWTVIPALAVDMFYTRAMFVAPGIQRAMHGKGDVEGFRVIYAMDPSGKLTVESAVADDGTHDTVYLDAAQVMALDPDRPTFYSSVWSHQLGGHGLQSVSDLAYRRCFGPGHVRPLPDSLAHEFALAGRAPPAHVEALGGRVLGGATQIAKAPEAPPRL